MTNSGESHFGSRLKHQYASSDSPRSVYRRLLESATQKRIRTSLRRHGRRKSEILLAEPIFKDE